MIRCLFFVGAMGVSLCSWGQKAKISKFKIPVQTASFPVYDVPLDMRTYDIVLKGRSFYKRALDGIELRNFTRDKENAHIVFQVSIRPLKPTQVNIREWTDTKKDKDGKVISSRTYYYGDYKNIGLAYLDIFADELPKFVFKTKKQQEREEVALRKEEEAQRQREMDLEERADDNPFLSGVNTSGADAYANELDEEEEIKKRHSRISQQNFSRDYAHSTKRMTSSRMAHSAAAREIPKTLPLDTEDFMAYLNVEIEREINRQFNYTKRVENAVFRTLSNDKHPENEQFNQAMEALKIILSKMRYNKPNEEVGSDVLPIVGYFEDVAAHYSNKDKQGRKIRGAALYNLAKISFYLDDQDALKIYGRQLVDDGYYRDGIGEGFVDKANLIFQRKAFYDSALRYIQPYEDSGFEDDAEIIADEDDFDEDLD
ncbi:hypothetical protein LAG90_00230 [Marinilongibacter aquaticus]|uniref:hypothetical protein n=1 Tax=Marinilongibacter aquaticus TaxID=2975157 RepID=UPI0021BD69A1|nr:hypothetical protein [Marinilongibacter aquaticus]UBM59086.1 hypothetical protein LAG90_00230 [Marinilongibacter aquaticus]